MGTACARTELKMCSRTRRHVGEFHCVVTQIRDTKIQKSTSSSAERCTSCHAIGSLWHELAPLQVSSAEERIPQLGRHKISHPRGAVLIGPGRSGFGHERQVGVLPSLPSACREGLSAADWLAEVDRLNAPTASRNSWLRLYRKRHDVLSP